MTSRKEIEGYLVDRGFTRDGRAFKKKLRVNRDHTVPVVINIHQPRETIWISLDVIHDFGMKYYGRVRDVEFLKALLENLKYRSPV